MSDRGRRIGSKFRLPNGGGAIKSHGYQLPPGGDRDASQFAGVCRRAAERYLRAPRAEKHRLLTEVVAVTGLHRKAAIRLLRRPLRPATSRPRSGRPRRYGPAVAAAAHLLSEATGHIGPHRWHPFLPELLDRLTRSGDVGVTPEVDKHLRQVSPATLARLLAPFRRTLPHRGLTTTRPGAWLKHQIPVRTFAEWTDAQPGFLELDLVAHCGPTTMGFYLYTSAPSMSRPRGSTSSRLGQGPETGRHRHPPRPPAPAHACCAAWTATTFPLQEAGEALETEHPTLAAPGRARVSSSATTAREPAQWSSASEESPAAHSAHRDPRRAGRPSPYSIQRRVPAEGPSIIYGVASSPRRPA